MSPQRTRLEARRLLRQLATALALLVFAGATAHAQVSLLVRGTITAFDGSTLSVKTLEGSELRLRLSDITLVVVPAGTPIATDTRTDRSALKPGEYIFTSAAVGADGTMTVQRIEVSRDGIKPPQ